MRGRVAKRARMGLAFWLPKRGYMSCQRCRMPQWAVTSHPTLYEATGESVAPGEQAVVTALCVWCFTRTTPETRVLYYRTLFAMWLLEASAESDDEARWAEVKRLSSMYQRIETAVLEGR